MEYLPNIEDLLYNLEDKYEIQIGDQESVKRGLTENYSFPMICFEHTKESGIEVSFDESKFLNDNIHEGTWFVGSDLGNIMFVMNLQVRGNVLEIDALEVNESYHGVGIGSAIVSIVEEYASHYFDKIIVSPFDYSAHIFWEHLGYESDYGFLTKKL